MEQEEKRLGIYRAEKPHTAEEIGSDAKKRLSLINKEFAEGFEFIKKYPKSVTFFGSSVIPENDVLYKKARELAEKISEIGYTVVTGGGPGIMEAANRGAFEAKSQSVGLNIQLPHEQIPNPYLTDCQCFHYFFSRKVALTFAAEAYIFFPGGYGTLNEFFEIIMLIQTQRIKSVPVFLFDSHFWKPLDAFMRNYIYEKHHMVEEKDLLLYTISDNYESVIKAIRTAPIVPDLPFNGDKE